VRVSYNAGKLQLALGTCEFSPDGVFSEVPRHIPETLDRAVANAAAR